jgi:outer membrane immunogenic protein
VAFGEVEESFVSDTGAIVATRGGDGMDVGYAVGAGVEAMVTERVSVGIEYLYTDLGDSDYTVNLSGAAGTGPGNAFSNPARGPSTDAQGSDRDFDFSTVSVKVSYRF